MRTKQAAKAGRDSAASIAGTERYRDRITCDGAPDFYRPLSHGPLVSSIGLGTYLGECDDADDRGYAASVRFALERGINVLDVAINYRCQRSERTVGAVLREAIDAHVVARDEVVVCTKGGYVPLEGTPPASREEYQAYVQREFFDAGVMTPADVVAGGHSLAVPFLSHQLERSRANLCLRTIDVYYVHNPEQQLDVIAPARFRTLMRHAFAMLEQRVADGDIGCYGVSTWKGFRVVPGTRGHLSLHELVSIARDVGGVGHHFKVVQLPINLAMSEAVRLPTQTLGGQRTVPLLQAASELGISVIASATLMQSQLTSGLPAEVRDAFPRLETDAQRAIAFVRSLPAVSSALIGMKRVEHVTENLEAARAAT